MNLLKNKGKFAANNDFVRLTENLLAYKDHPLAYIVNLLHLNAISQTIYNILHIFTLTTSSGRTLFTNFFT